LRAAGPSRKTQEGGRERSATLGQRSRRCRARVRFARRLRVRSGRRFEDAKQRERRTYEANAIGRCSTRTLIAFVGAGTGASRRIRSRRPRLLRRHRRLLPAPAYRVVPAPRPSTVPVRARAAARRAAGTGISRPSSAHATRSASVRVAAGPGSGSIAGYGSGRRFEDAKQRARRACEAEAIDRSPFCSEGRMQWTTGAFESCASDAFARTLTDCGGAGRQWYGSAEACVARADGFAKNVAELRLISGPKDEIRPEALRSEVPPVTISWRRPAETGPDAVRSCKRRSTASTPGAVGRLIG
jgi:hypothetical protein